MTKLFLSLDDAVSVATKAFGIDSLLARQEFEQKCYVPDNQYVIGYYDGLDDAIEAIKDKAESEDDAIKRKAGTPREDYMPLYNCENWIP